MKEALRHCQISVFRNCDFVAVQYHETWTDGLWCHFLSSMLTSFQQIEVVIKSEVGIIDACVKARIFIRFRLNSAGL